MLWRNNGIGVDPTNCPTGSPPAPDARAWYSSQSPQNRSFPYAGFEIWRNSNPGCTESKVDAYRGLVTFNTSALSNLKGLVTKAELIVNVRALPASAGTVSTLASTPAVNVTCPAMVGGAGSLMRFGPAQAASLPQLSSISTALLDYQAPATFPSGQVVYNFAVPSQLPGPVAGATDPTNVIANGTGGVTFTTDVTSQVQAALNLGANMSWMLTSIFEGPLPGPVRVTGDRDCKTAYDMRLVLTHL